MLSSPQIPAKRGCPRLAPPLCVHARRAWSPSPLRAIKTAPESVGSFWGWLCSHHVPLPGSYRAPLWPLLVAYRGSWDEGSSQRPCWVAPRAQHFVGALPGFLGALVGERKALHTPKGQVPRDSSLELRKHRGPYQATVRGPRGAPRPSPGARWGLPLLWPPTRMSLAVESRGWYLWLHASLA